MRQFLWGAAQLVVFGVTYWRAYEQQITQAGGQNPGGEGALAALFAASFVTIIFATATMWIGIGLSRWHANRARRRKEGAHQRVDHGTLGRPAGELRDSSHSRLARK